MKTQASFEIRADIKGHINLNISGSQTYNELWQIQRTSAVYKTLFFRWHRKFQDGSRPGQPKTIVTNVNIAAVAVLTKRDARLTLKNIALSVDILSGSTHKILTQQ